MLWNAVSKLRIHITIDKAKEQCNTKSYSESAIHNLHPSKLIKNPVKSVMFQERMCSFIMSLICLKDFYGLKDGEEYNYYFYALGIIKSESKPAYI